MARLPIKLIEGQHQATNPITNTPIAQQRAGGLPIPPFLINPKFNVQNASTKTKLPIVQKLFAPTTTNAPITAVYGQYPSHPNEWRGKNVHTGTDYGVRAGTAAFAESAGKILHAGYDPTVGNYVTLETSPGHSINYEHLSSIGVKQGQSVTGGFQLGKTGDTGSAAEGAHLHVEYTAGGNLVAPESYWNIKNEKDEPGWLHNGENDSAPQNLGSAFRYAGMSPREVSNSATPNTTQTQHTTQRNVADSSYNPVNNTSNTNNFSTWGRGVGGDEISLNADNGLQSVGIARRRSSFGSGLQSQS